MTIGTVVIDSHANRIHDLPPDHRDEIALTLKQITNRHAGDRREQNSFIPGDAGQTSVLQYGHVARRGTGRIPGHGGHQLSRDPEVQIRNPGIKPDEKTLLVQPWPCDHQHCPPQLAKPKNQLL
jgi:hypothetical protein